MFFDGGDKVAYSTSAMPQCPVAGTYLYDNIPSFAGLDGGGVGAATKLLTLKSRKGCESQLEVAAYRPSRLRSSGISQGNLLWPNSSRPLMIGSAKFSNRTSTSVPCIGLPSPR